ncbi:MAG: hypothetical protein HY731_11620 [Candidatus Tectomicrobia bacterium]|nr:hypothetical protein [Candidatus Tectomicrobia bacterium]
MMKILYQLTSPMEKTVLGKEEVSRRRDFLNRYASPGVTVEVQSIPWGPSSIESAYEAALVVPGVLQATIRAEAEGYNAVIIGCFSDPGIEAIREVVTIPVIGPGTSAMHLAAQVGSSFSIISPLEGKIGSVRARLRALGLEAKFASVRGMGMSVLDLARQREEALQKIAAVGMRAVEEDGADVLVLGCMSMAFLGITDELQTRIGVPVVNPVTAALKTTELLVSINLTHSKRAYPFPPKQEIV